MFYNISLETASSSCLCNQGATITSNLADGAGAGATAAWSGRCTGCRAQLVVGLTGAEVGTIGDMF